jgi:hypothetical protein
MNDKTDTKNLQKKDLLQKALSQWDTEGGAGPCGPQESANIVQFSSKRVRHFRDKQA